MNTSKLKRHRNWNFVGNSANISFEGASEAFKSITKERTESNFSWKEDQI